MATVDPKETPKRQTNREFTADPALQAASKAAAVGPTTRQAPKFRRKRGIAYRVVASGHTRARGAL